MRPLRLLLLLVFALGLAACSQTSSANFVRGKEPQVTSIQVHKAKRKMYLLKDRNVVKSYDIGLGFNPIGHKQFEGDGKTPEGAYRITYKNPNSSFHLSLYIDYPNTKDRAFAAAHGKSPGGQIFIHGGPRRPTNRKDWTEGCIAVTNTEITEIYSMVPAGTPVFIYK